MISRNLDFAWVRWIQKPDTWALVTPPGGQSKWKKIYRGKHYWEYRRFMEPFSSLCPLPDLDGESEKAFQHRLLFRILTLRISSGAPEMAKAVSQIFSRKLVYDPLEFEFFQKLDQMKNWRPTDNPKCQASRLFAFRWDAPASEYDTYKASLVCSECVWIIRLIRIPDVGVPARRWLLNRTTVCRVMGHDPVEITKLYWRGNI